MPTFRLYKGGTKVRECHPIWSKTGKIWSPMGPPLPTCFRQVHINALTVTIVCLCDNITLTFHFYKTILEQNNRFHFTYCRTEAKQSSKVVAVSVCVCACTCCTVLGPSTNPFQPPQPIFCVLHSHHHLHIRHNHAHAQNRIEQVIDGALQGSQIRTQLRQKA